MKYLFLALSVSIVMLFSASLIKERMKLANLSAGAERPLGGALPRETL